MVHERHNGEDRPHTSESQPQQKKDKILLISGVCIPIGLILYVLASLLFIGE